MENKAGRDTATRAARAASGVRAGRSFERAGPRAHRAGGCSARALRQRDLAGSGVAAAAAGANWELIPAPVAVRDGVVVASRTAAADGHE